MHLGKVALKLHGDGHFVGLKIVLQQFKYQPNNTLDIGQRPLIGRLFR
jgi:hypothetical protein